MSPKMVCDLFDFLSALQEEQVEWDDVNKLLQHHGFKPVMFADPVENKNLSGMCYLCVHMHVYFQCNGMECKLEMKCKFNVSFM